MRMAAGYVDPASYGTWCPNGYGLDNELLGQSNPPAFGALVYALRLVTVRTTVPNKNAVGVTFDPKHRPSKRCRDHLRGRRISLDRCWGLLTKRARRWAHSLCSDVRPERALGGGLRVNAHGVGHDQFRMTRRHRTKSVRVSHCASHWLGWGSDYRSTMRQLDQGYYRYFVHGFTRAFCSGSGIRCLACFCAGIRGFALTYCFACASGAQLGR